MEKFLSEPSTLKFTIEFIEKLNPKMVNYVRADFSESLETLPQDQEYEIKFNDLTAREDMCNSDQAISKSGIASLLRVTTVSIL